MSRRRRELLSAHQHATRARAVDNDGGRRPDDWLGRIAWRLIDWRWALLLLAALLTVGAAYKARTLEFNRSVETMFAADDQLLGSYQRLKNIFGGDELVLAAYKDPQMFLPAGNDRLMELTAKLKGVPGVAGVYSMADYGKAVAIQKVMRELTEGFLFNVQQDTVAVVCMLKPVDAAEIPRNDTIDRLDAIVRKHDPTGVLAGEPVMIAEGFQHLEQDGQRLGWASTGLLLAVIAVCFRSLRWVLIPLAVMFAALAWTEGLLAVVGFRLTLVSSMLWSLVTVIAVATTVHVIVGFRVQRQHGAAPRIALREALALLIAPVVWSCLTDAVGFGSLMVARVGPVRDFGWMMALASLLVLLAIVMVLPGLALAGRFDSTPRQPLGERRLDALLERVLIALRRRPKLLALSIVAIAALAVAGIPRLRMETDFTKNFRAGSPLVRSYEFVEANLGGAGMWDVIVPLPTKSDGEFPERLRRLQRRLKSEAKIVDDRGRSTPGLTNVISGIDFIDGIAASFEGLAKQLGQITGALGVPKGEFPSLTRPANSEDLAFQLDALKVMAPMFNLLHGTDPDSKREYVRILLRSHERRPAEAKQRLIDDVRRICREEFPESEVTGLYVLLAYLIDSVNRDQWYAFGLAALGIGLMLVAALRSVRLALVALVPNALPILMVTGAMGWLGFHVNLGTAMIASVSMGLAVDSSIHYLTEYQRRRAAGASATEAIDAAQQTVGRAISLSTLALVAGFSALAFSEFIPTITFGLLAALSMFGGLLGNLVVLPLLLTLCERD